MLQDIPTCAIPAFGRADDPRETERIIFRRYVSGTVAVPGFQPKYGTAPLELKIGYNLYGTGRLPVVAVLGGLSANRHVIHSKEERRTGWWNEVVGPGLAVDLCRCRVLSFDYLTRLEQPGGARIPVSTEDQANALAALLDALRIERLTAVVGASYGAMAGFAFAARHPTRLDRLVAISGADRAHPLATAFRAVQRRIARLGAANGAAFDGLKLARSLGLATYRSHREFARRFSGAPRFENGEWRFEVEDVLSAEAENYARRVAPERFIRLSESLDLHCVEPAQVRVPVTLVAADPDLLVPLEQLQALAEALGDRCRLCIIESDHGHDAFLYEASKLAPILHTALEGDKTHALTA